MSNAHFYLHHHPRQEVLAQHLVGKLREEGQGNPFHKSTVLVRNQGMATWISQQMAQKCGISMQVDFPQPNTFLDSILGDSNISQQGLLWKIHDSLPSLCRQTDFSKVHQYLENGQSDDKKALKLYQLSGHLSSLFDKYLLYRPEWIQSWNQGRKVNAGTHEPWQRKLWQLISGSLTEHWAQKLLDKQELPEHASLPEALHVFGISNFAPIYVHFLYLLSRRIPVHVYWMNPVEGYWGDSPDAREWVMAKAYDEPSVLMNYNPLVAGFGRMGREFVHTIYGGKCGNHEVQEEELAVTASRDTAKNRLHAVQQGIYQNNPVELQFPDSDRSISIHSCFTPLRELETLKTFLLTLAEESPLDAGDVLVLCPDMETYAPAIEAVFGIQQNDKLPHIPYRLSDRLSAANDPTIAAILHLFTLGSSRFTNKEALQLLAIPAVARKLELDQDDLADIKRWIQQNGIRWGMDEEHVSASFSTPIDATWTWRSGLDRMLLGYAMPNNSSSPILWNDILPFHDIEGSNARTVGALCSFIEWCSSIRKSLDSPKNLDEWVTCTRQWLDNGLDKSDETSEQLYPVYKALEQIEEQAKLTTSPLPAEVFKEHLSTLLGGSSAARGFLSGPVTFCEMKPMRSIPARVICMLGMNHDSFPRRDNQVQFDLTKGHRREGDRSTRDDDVYCFLETILSARENIFISYLGKSIKDGKDLPPSTALQSLIDYTPGLAQCIRQEKLHAFDPSYFNGDFPLSHDTELLQVAESYSRQSEPREAHKHLQPGNLESSRDLTIDELIASLCTPGKYFLRNGLRVRVSYLEELIEENEPLEIGSLSAWQFKNTLLNQRQNTEELLPQWKQQSLIPPGEIGQQAIDGQFGGIDALVPELPDIEWLEVSITVAGYDLTGKVPVSSSDGTPVVTVIHPSKRKPKSQLSTWIYTLIASLETGEALTGQLIGLSGSGINLTLAYTTFNTPENARQLLEQLVALHHEARTSPLQHFPKTAEAYWSVEPKAGETEDKLTSRRRKAASEAWRNYKHPDSAEDYAPVLHPGGWLFTDDFLRISETIWAPLVSNRFIEE